MGRTSRKRRRKKRLSFVELNEITDESLIDLKSWLLSKNCVSIRYLTPEHFPLTGRGLKTLKRVERDEVLIRLPLRTLLTTDVLSRSDVKTLFLRTTDSFTPQCMLATFLVYETHLGTESKWYLYLKTLPRSFTNPDFCSNKEKAALPGFISHPLRQAHKLQADFSVLVKRLDVDRSRCPHCSVRMQKIITFARYKWAYYVVNTRAVYIDAEVCKEDVFNVKQPNNLALAPFLDLFNHDVNAAVKVSVVTDDCRNQFYQIATLKPFDEGTQVFINYGAHDSLKLYVEYGFFIPRNPLDEIQFDAFDVQRCFDVSRNKLDFITFNGFHKSMSFTRDGLNYNATVALFVLSTKLEKDRWKLKIYGETFDTDERCIINKLGISILNLKRTEYASALSKMKNVKPKSPSFSIAINLVEEYINILDAAFNSMEKIGKTVLH